MNTDNKKLMVDFWELLYLEDSCKSTISINTQWLENFKKAKGKTKEEMEKRYGYTNQSLSSAQSLLEKIKKIKEN